LAVLGLQTRQRLTPGFGSIDGAVLFLVPGGGSIDGPLLLAAEGGSIRGVLLEVDGLIGGNFWTVDKFVCPRKPILL